MTQSNPTTQFHSRTRRLLATIGLASLLGLTACGGGSSSDPTTGAGDPGAGTVPTPNPTPTPGAASCPMAQLSDAWIDKRLGCLTVGQTLIELAGTASGARADLAVVIRQLTLDSRWNNVLEANKARHFQHFLCVKNAPATLTEGLNRLSLATDLAVAIGTNNGSATKPPQVTGIALEVAGGDRPGWQHMACDRALHPVIVDYDTRRIDSVNAPALAALQIYDR